MVSLAPSLFSAHSCTDFFFLNQPVWSSAQTDSELRMQLFHVMTMLQSLIVAHIFLLKQKSTIKQSVFSPWDEEGVKGIAERFL